ALTPAHFPLSLHDALPIFTPSPEQPRQTFARSSFWSIAEIMAILLVWWIEKKTNARSMGVVPICIRMASARSRVAASVSVLRERSEEHTSELQSPYDLVCR